MRLDKEATKAYNKIYYTKNKERLIRASVDWGRRNREKKLESTKKSIRKNIERFRDYQRRYRQRNKGRYPMYYAEKRLKIRQTIFELLGGGFCRRCGFTDYRALQLDHINGGGSLDNQMGRSITRIRDDVIAHPDKYQVLCANCNWIKRSENKEWGKPKL